MKYYVITALNPLTETRDVVSVPMSKRLARELISKMRKREPGVYRMYRIRRLTEYLTEYEPQQLFLWKHETTVSK